MSNAPAECPWVGHGGSGFGYHSGADGWCEDDRALRIFSIAFHRLRSPLSAGSQHSIAKHPLQALR